MTSEIDKLKHIQSCNYCPLARYLCLGIDCRAVILKQVKYKTDTDKMTASDYTHLFGYLNPYYRTAYSIPKRKR